MRAGDKGNRDALDIRTLLDRSRSLCSQSTALKINIANLDTRLQQLIRHSTDLIEALRYQRLLP